MGPNLPELLLRPLLAGIPILHQELHEAFDLEHLGEEEGSILLNQPLEEPRDHAEGPPEGSCLTTANVPGKHSAA
jgi:hypothetical protein